MQTNEKEIIIEHALENEKSLEIMLDIIATDPKLQQIINTSLEKSGKFDFKEINMRSWYSLDLGLRKSITETVVKKSSDIMSKDNNSGKERMIIEHALENEKNLEMTLDIISAGDELRERIIKPFLKELQVFICKKLDMSQLDMSQWEWETELYDKPFEGNKYHSFGIKFDQEPFDQEPFDQEPIVISLLGNPTGNNLDIYIAVLTTNQLFHKSRDLRCKLDKTFGKGDEPNEQWKRWFWSQPLKPSYADWYSKGTLIEMRTETDRVVKDIGKRLLEIIKVAKPEIEKWVKQNPSAQ